MSWHLINSKAAERSAPPSSFLVRTTTLGVRLLGAATMASMSWNALARLRSPFRKEMSAGKMTPSRTSLLPTSFTKRSTEEDRHDAARHHEEADEATAVISRAIKQYVHMYSVGKKHLVLLYVIKCRYTKLECPLQQLSMCPRRSLYE